MSRFTIYLTIMIANLTSAPNAAAAAAAGGGSGGTVAPVPSEEEEKKLAELREKLDRNKLTELEVDLTLSSAAKAGHQAVLEWLLIFPKGRLRPGPLAINSALGDAAEAGHQALVEWFLSRPENPSWPNQLLISQALKSAAAGGHQALVEWLLNRPEGQVRPNQYGINGAFIFAANRSRQAIVTLLLNRPAGQLRPDQNTIVGAYRNAFANGHVAIADLLRPHVPAEELVAPAVAGGAGRGYAMEVHNYASSAVTLPAAAASEAARGLPAAVAAAGGASGGAAAASSADARCASPKTGKLNEVVLQVIRDRLAGDSLMAFKTILGTLHTWIDNHIAPGQRATTQAALMNGMEVDYAPGQLQLIYTFITKYHSSKMDLWARGFIEESITAYLGRSNTLSCTKGVTERMVTGLRGIDSELDALFAQAESPLMAKKLMALLNPGDADGKTWMITRLKELRVTKDTSAPEAVAKLSDYVNGELVALGLTPAVHEEYSGQLKENMELIEEHYEDMIRPHL